MRMVKLRSIRRAKIRSDMMMIATCKMRVSIAGTKFKVTMISHWATREDTGKSRLSKKETSKMTTQGFLMTVR